MSAEKGGPIPEGGDSMICSPDDVTTTPQAEPFLNHDVIRHICKFLAIPDIKNCRIISPLWNYGATPVLKSRTRTTLNFSPGYDDNGDPFGWNISDVVKKLEFYPANVLLAIPSTHEVNLPPPPDFARFPTVNKFKSVIFQYPVGPRFHWQRELFTKLILSSSPTLEGLKSDCLKDEVPLDFPPLGGNTVFPKMKNLKVDKLFESYGAVKRIGHAVTTSFPNLTYFKAKCNHLDGLAEEGVLQNLPRSLTSLKLGGDLDTNGLECLLKIPAGLKKLVFGDSHRIDYEINGREDELPPILYKLLKKHAPTLVELDIAITWVNEGRKLEWKFPVFPALKKLTFDYSNLVGTVVFETGLESGNFGGINYPVCFPVLEALHIFSDTKSSSKVESFFPEGIVQSVKEVDVDVDVRIDDTDADVLKQVKIYVRLIALFPNARDHVMKNLRDLLDVV